MHMLSYVCVISYLQCFPTSDKLPENLASAFYDNSALRNQSTIAKLICRALMTQITQSEIEVHPENRLFGTTRYSLKHFL